MCKSRDSSNFEQELVEPAWNTKDLLPSLSTLSESSSTTSSASSSSTSTRTRIRRPKLATTITSSSSTSCPIRQRYLQRLGIQCQRPNQAKQQDPLHNKLIRMTSSSPPRSPRSVIFPHWAEETNTKDPSAIPLPVLPRLKGSNAKTMRTMTTLSRKTNHNTADKHVSFAAHVCTHVHTIPSRHDYSLETRRRLWTTAYEERVQVARNTYEWERYEHKQWQNAAEEAEFVWHSQSSTYVHPVWNRHHHSSPPLSPDRLPSYVSRRQQQPQRRPSGKQHFLNVMAAQTHHYNKPKWCAAAF